MPDGGFHVNLKVLEAHERELRALLAQMPDAADAGSGAGSSLWNPDVFGIVGMVPAQILRGWIDDAVDFVGKAKGAGVEMAGRFKEMREAYADGDQESAAMFDAILKQLEGRK
jgi:hypothetical protein